MAGNGKNSSVTTVKAVTKPPAVVINSYVQDNLRWDKDVYKVASGGTLHVVNNAADEGPHTFTIVKKKDAPRTGLQIAELQDLRDAREGARRESEQRRAAEVPVPRERGRPADAAAGRQAPATPGVTGKGKKGESINLTVTRPGRDEALDFMCLIHPWMQAEVDVT